MSATRSTVGTVGVAGVTVLIWWLWLGRDTGYQTDPVTGVTSGPYEAWQVAGCVLCLTALAVLGALFLSPWLVTAAITLAFTVAWGSVAAADDPTGMWAVGAMMVLVGTAAGSALLSFTAHHLRRRPHRPS
jgi:hypothetical protein